MYGLFVYFSIIAASDGHIKSQLNSLRFEGLVYLTIFWVLGICHDIKHFMRYFQPKNASTGQTSYCIKVVIRQGFQNGCMFCSKPFRDTKMNHNDNHN